VIKNQVECDGPGMWHVSKTYEVHCLCLPYTRGADKSLARPTSRCRTESIVSLERGYLHVQNCKYFLVTEAERKHVRRHAQFQHGDASCHQGLFFSPARQGAELNSRHSDRNIRRTCTIVCHRQKPGGPV